MSKGRREHDEAGEATIACSAAVEATGVDTGFAGGFAGSFAGGFAGGFAGCAAGRAGFAVLTPAFAHSPLALARGRALPI